MQTIESLLADNTAALIANTAALKEVLSAAVMPRTAAEAAAEQAKAAPAKKTAKTKAAPLTVVEPDEPETPAEPEVEKPTKVEVNAPAEEEFSDPLDPDTKVVVKGTPAPAKIDPDAVITQITDAWKALHGAADAARKLELKEVFPTLRTKWGLKDGEKLSVLASTPEKLVGLLEDIQAL